MLWLDLEVRSQTDLVKNGLMRYATCPTTNVICMSYAFDDNQITTWFAEDGPFPAEVIHYIQNTDKPITAHNAAFERYIFDFVLSNDYNFTPPALTRWQCSSARAMAHGLPASLGDICRALDLPVQKQPEGARLIRDYCAPHHDTAWKPGDKELMALYCHTDVETMRMFCSVLRQLAPEEWEQYHITERMNDRGVPLDLSFVNAALEYADDVRADVASEIAKLTAGRILKPTDRKNRDLWLAENLTQELLELITVKKSGVEKIKFDAEHRKILLQHSDTPQVVADFIELVEQAGGATISKYKAMANTHVNGRVFGSLIWNGAGATGRYSSRGLQLQNFKRDVFKDPEPLIQNVISGLSIDKPAASLGRLIRSAITSPDGLTFSDYSQIEARVLPWLTADPRAEVTLDIFRNGRDLYSENAIYMFNLKSREEVTPDLRQSAKQGVLACLHADSKVVTYGGIKRLIDVKTNDLLWDGESWVKHQGVVYKGKRTTIEVDGLWLTQDHLILTNGIWKQAQELASSPKNLKLALETGSVSLKSLGLTMGQRGVLGGSKSSAIVEQSHTLSWITAFVLDVLRAVTSALKRNQRKQTQGTETYCLTSNTAAAYFPEYQPASTDALTQKHHIIKTMAVGGYKSIKSGLRTGVNFLRTLSPLITGTGQSLSLIGLTTGKDTSRVTSPLLESNRTHLTAGLSQKCKTESTSLNHVYDIVNAGRNNRFTVLTDSGAMVVHNCGFGGGAGAVQAMAKAYGLKYTTEQADAIKTAWRTANPWAYPFWYGLKEAAHTAVKYPGTQQSHGRLTFMYDGADWLWMKLPSGRCLAYFAPRFELVTYPWGAEGWELTCLWGSGKPKAGERWPRRVLNHLILSENATQATAADVMREAIVRAHKAGLNALFSVHDELVVEGKCFDELHQVMTKPPTWAKGLPIDADTQTANRYGK